MAQSRDSLIFLGDTISIDAYQYQNLASKVGPLFQKIKESENTFLVKKTGAIQLENINFQIGDPLDDGITKVLILGNSFSDDGVEYYLHDMAKQEGKALVIGNLFRGGAPLDFHLKNALENNKIYSYRKTTVDGIKTNTNRTSILEAIKDENWDYICFQQASLLSGDLESVQRDLPLVFNYIAEQYPVSTVKYLFHQTWAYAKNSKTKNFEKYNKNQQEMFEKIVTVSKEVKNIVPIDLLIPSGTAIQNGRTTYIGDNFTREGYHLDLSIGRFTAASTWYETLFGNIRETAFKPFTLNENEASLAKEAAFQALKNPFEITTLDKYIQQPILNNPIGKIQVNFGSDLIIPGWNTFLFENKETMMSNLLNTNNDPTSVNIYLNRSFDSRGGKGPQKTITDLKMPKEVSSSNFIYKISPTDTDVAHVIIENLNPNKEYSIQIFASDKNIENNEISYVLKGDNTNKLKLNPKNNNTKVLFFEKIGSTKRGIIELKFEASLANSSAVINAITIQEL